MELSCMNFSRGHRMLKLRMPRPSVSLRRIYLGPPDQTKFSRGVIWSTHIAIHVDLFVREPVIYSPKPGRPGRMGLIMFNMILYLFTLIFAKRAYDRRRRVIKRT